MDRGMHVLIIEDDQEDAIIIQKSLHNEATIKVRSTHRETLKAGIEEYNERPQDYDAILLDLHLNDSVGLRTLRRVVEVVHNVPVIVLTGLSSDELALEALGDGAQDYISKRDILSGSLVKKVRYAVERQRLLNEVSKAKNEIAKMAEYKNQFLAQMSHEIRTPLNGIIGNASLLEFTALNDYQRELAHVIRDSGDLLCSIIDDILDISGFESGDIVLKLQRVNIRQLVEKVIDSLGYTVETKAIVLTNYVEKNVPKYAFVDQYRLRQILTNLVSNSIKYTEQGCVCIKVSLQSSQDDKRLRFEVHDTGRGIPREKIQSLFTPYSQVSYFDQVLGTGLGLVICMRLTRMMQGEIGVDSKEGEGSTFWFIIKCELEEEPFQTRAALENKQVLLIGARDQFSSVLENQMISRGMEPLFAEVNEEMISWKHDPAPDLILVSAMNPGLTENTKHILSDLKSNLSLSRTPVIVMANKRNLDDLRRSSPTSTMVLPPPQSALYALLAATIEGRTQERLADSISQSLKPSWRPYIHEVLIVDDVEGNIKVTEKMLDILQVKTSVALDGSEAIEACKAKKFDLILMDCKMPGLSGFETTMAIRRSPIVNSSTVIVALSANALREDREKARLAGMNDYLTKPLKIVDLLRMLEKWLSKNLGAIDPH